MIAAAPMMISAFTLSTCTLRHVPATKYARAGDEILVAAPVHAVQAKACASNAADLRLALRFRKSRSGQDPALLEPLREEVRALEPLRCGVLEAPAGAAGIKYDFTLTEYRRPGGEDPTRFAQVVRTAKAGGRRTMVYFREYSGDIDSRTAIKAVCDFDADGFPDVALDVCGKGGCGASVLRLDPRTGEAELREIEPPADE